MQHNPKKATCEKATGLRRRSGSSDSLALDVQVEEALHERQSKTCALDLAKQVPLREKSRTAPVPRPLPRCVGSLPNNLPTHRNLQYVQEPAGHQESMNLLKRLRKSRNVMQRIARDARIKTAGRKVQACRIALHEPSLLGRQPPSSSSYLRLVYVDSGNLGIWESLRQNPSGDSAAAADLDDAPRCSFHREAKESIKANNLVHEMIEVAVHKQRFKFRHPCHAYHCTLDAENHDDPEACVV
jgi:hypothetical protein